MVRKFKKHLNFKLILSLTLVLTIIFSLITVNAESYDKQAYYTIIEELRENVLKENKDLPIEERYSNLNIDINKLDTIDTDSLISIILEYPLLGNIFAYDNTIKGISVLSQEFNPISLIIDREDAAQFIELRLSDPKIEDDFIKTSFLKALMLYIQNENFDLNIDNSTASQTTIKTPQGTSVTVYIRGEELSNSEKNNINAYFDSAYPNATRLSSATTNYNCHSYAWYSASTSNRYWMNDPTAYMTDGSYIKASSSEGKRVFYPNSGSSHSGLYSGGTVTSKWGMAGLYQHSLSHCPYGTSGVTYYKFNSNIPTQFIENEL